MNSLDDWLKAFAIHPPMEYLQNLGLPKALRIFGRTEIESRFSFFGQRLRPKLFSEFFSEPHVFGPNVSVVDVVVVRRHDEHDRVESPEFFHRKINADTFSDQKFDQLVVQLLDEVTKMTF